MQRIVNGLNQLSFRFICFFLSYSFVDCMKQLFQLIIYLFLLTALPALAKYKVSVEAPASVSDLVRDNIDLTRYKDREDFSGEQIQFLLDTTPKAVAGILATEGYFSPTTSVITLDLEGIKEYIIQVTTGEQTKVSLVNIDIQGAIQSEDQAFSEQLMKEWNLKVGMPFRQEDWSKQKDHILQRMQDHRFAAATLQSSEAIINKNAHTATLHVVYNSGSAFTLGALAITGVSRYPDSIIRNVNPLYEGEEYTFARLQSLQRQIQNTNYYSNAIVDIDEQAKETTNVPVKVHVSELPKHRIRTGIGYSTNTGKQLEGRYTFYNTFNRGWIFDAQAKVEQRRQLFSLNLAMPPDTRSYVHSIGVTQDRTITKGVDLRSSQIGLKRTRSSDDYDTTFSLTYYDDELTQENDATLPANTIVPIGRHRALVPGFAWSRRKIDNPIFPREGDTFSIELGVAAKGALTDQNFGRIYTRYKQFFPVFSRDLIIWRTDLGGIITSGRADQIPASLLFRTGGTDSIRGYSYQSIGNTQNGTVFPTKYLLTTSLEYQHWFTDSWGAALFYDIGTATDVWKNRTLYQGTGVGARWRSPVGTLQLDIAYGQRSHSIRPHISLGIAF